jgi:hypothetical protein
MEPENPRVQLIAKDGTTIQGLNQNARAKIK